MKNLIGQSLGRYQIIDKLGEGGMAIVFKAFDTHLECDVAVKVIRTEQLAPSVLDRTLKRFEREAKEVAKLNHPNIVQVIDYGEENGIPYLVMPYIHGGTLKQLLGRPMHFQEAAALLEPIARALEYAHQHKMIHRDVKPSNILLTDSGETILTDFGIVKMLDIENGNTLTGTGVGLGTPEYMAPEQWVGKSSQSVDQYSLGVVFYELITGEKPYTADTPAAVLLKQAMEPLTHPRKIIPELPEAVENIIFKVLSKDPANRFPNIGEFGIALKKLTNYHEEVVSSFLSSTIQISKPKKETEDMKTTDNLKSSNQMFSTSINQAEKNKYALGNQPQSSQKKFLKQIIMMAGLLLICTVVVALLLLKKNSTNWLLSNRTTSLYLENTISTSPVVTPKSNTPTSYTNNKVVASSLAISEIDGMPILKIPAGEFYMGSTQETGNENEKSQYLVYLDEFWIDQTEVTNAMYEKCVNAHACTEPNEYSSYTKNSYYGNSLFSNYPVININWDQAKSYCEWAGRQVPTEAQWEKAARGTDNRMYPWGNSFSCLKGNFDDETEEDDYLVEGGLDCDGFSDTSPVGYFPDGASPYGVMDMSGNVWEWVADWYGEYPYEYSSNPKGPSSGEFHILRGGSWDSDENQTSSVFRQSSNAASNKTGFRCSMNSETTSIETFFPTLDILPTSSQIFTPQIILPTRTGNPTSVPTSITSIDSDNDGVIDSLDECPTDGLKTIAGVCGCFWFEEDVDKDGHCDSYDDACPHNSLKWKDGGVCGCDANDIDSDGDGMMDCVDPCPNNPDTSCS